MKVVVWGLPIHTHTHSYIHHAFVRASHFNGFETHWVENSKESNRILSDGTVVICCGIADDCLELKNGVRYVLHNSSRSDLRLAKHINLQVYTTDVFNRDTEKLNNELTFWENKTRTLFQPWATDLLPQEIEAIGPKDFVETNEIAWVGTVNHGEQGNFEELLEYSRLCASAGLAFKHTQYVSVKDNIRIVRNSRHAPAIQGAWQVEKGYVPCRVFKNFSYGCWAETNSKTVSELLGIKFHENIESLYADSENKHKQHSKSDIKEKMNLVADKHTYINRLNSILYTLERI